MTETAEVTTQLTAITIGLPITALCITPATEAAIDPADINQVVADMLVRGTHEPHLYDLDGVFVAAVPVSDGLLKVFLASVQFSINQTEAGSAERFSGYVFVNPIRDDDKSGYESSWSRTLAYQRGDLPGVLLRAMQDEAVTQLTPHS